MKNGQLMYFYKLISHNYFISFVALYRPADLFAKGMKLLAKKKVAEGRDEWFEATLLNILSDHGIVSYSCSVYRL